VGTLQTSSQILAGIIGTQMLLPFDANSCTAAGDTGCVDLSGETASAATSAYNASDGPSRWTHYSIAVVVVNLIGLLGFTHFLPASKEECHALGKEQRGIYNEKRRAVITAVIIVLLVIYSIVASTLLMIPATSCLQFVGGNGC
jgi:hypothetical protein